MTTSGLVSGLRVGLGEGVRHGLFLWTLTPVERSVYGAKETGDGAP